MGAIPTVEITNGERRLIVNACDLSTWEAAGWSKPKPPTPPEEPPPPAPVEAAMPDFVAPAEAEAPPEVKAKSTKK